MKTTIFRNSVLACLMIFTAGSPSLLQAQSLIRGPYLQTLTQTNVVVRWRTDVATNGVVHYGASWTNLNMTATDATIATDHIVSVTGLSASASYYYDIGTDLQVLAGGDASHTFKTPPPVGSVEAVNIWIIGDSGTGDANAAAARDAYLGWRGTNATDVWLMLGDNAYNSGLDSEHQTAVFNMYPSLLRQTSPWPTFGNHESESGANSINQTGAYYDIFSLPKNGEAGGVPSGTEAYYSFDYANIHFICLNSMDIDRSPGGAMLSWLADDLLATTQEWLIAYWHHPTYTKGSHDSDNDLDSGGRMRDMRVNVLPVLEEAGVDLVLSGHSHSYERSYLLRGHYGKSPTFDINTMAIDSGYGREGLDGPYRKHSVTGQVSAVVGSSGKVTGHLTLHPAMRVSLYEVGSLALQIHDQRLDAYFINKEGEVRDYFSLEHVAPGAPDVANDRGAIDVDYMSATLRGELITSGTSPTDVFLYWGDQVPGSPTGAWQHVAALGIRTAGPLATNVTGLLPDTTYYYQYFATNVNGQQWAPNVSSFQTPRNTDFDTFLYKAKLTFSGYSGAETLVDFPALITMGTHIPAFDYSQFALPAAGDLRFSDALALRELDDEVETWNTNGVSRLWVKVPALSGANSYIWAYWGNASATNVPDSRSNGAVWSAGYAGVWHLNETGVVNRVDATTNANHAVPYQYSSSNAVDGWIDGADQFGGPQTNALRVSNSSSINMTNAITVSAWIRPDRWDADNVIVRRDEAYRLYNRDTRPTPVGPRNSALTFKLRGDVATEVNWPDSNMSTGEWAYVVGTYDRVGPGNNFRLYVNGAVVIDAAASGAIPITSDDLMIGMKSDGSQNFQGIIDEVRVSAVARSADWIFACWTNQQPASGFLTASAVMEVDGDNDGMPDVWEMANFGNTTRSAGTVADDFDFDGFPDRDEYVAGTSPTNSASLLMISSVNAIAGVGDILWWTSVSNRRYSIQQSTALFESAWFTGVSNLIATPPQNVHTATPAPFVERYYSIGVTAE
ncbi:MAG: DUF2341 domain-containing protein [Verrucomicrobia bacterium]|nr:DUF2341 domain-containing protein [Verrucomicrobiota bacterium]